MSTLQKGLGRILKDSNHDGRELGHRNRIEYGRKRTDRILKDSSHRYSHHYVGKGIIISRVGLNTVKKIIGRILKNSKHTYYTRDWRRGLGYHRIEKGSGYHNRLGKVNRIW